MAKMYRVDDSFDRAFFAGASCTFGVFDGVHRGHRFLLERTQMSALKSGGHSVVLTFDIDPDEIFRPQTHKKLMSNDDRLSTLAQSGMDAVAVLPFTLDFAALSPQEFLADLFGGGAPAYMHVGCDFRFGARAAGTVSDLQNWGKSSGTQICAHDLKSDDGKPITATLIRSLLSEGHIEEANRLLGHPYTLTAKVRAGRGEGAKFGFRTANLAIAPQFRILGDGVYAALVELGNTRYKAAVNVGIPATFADRATATCEVHILDFNGDLYGLPIKVEFMNWLRPMHAFDSIDELISTVKGNIAWVRENL